MGQCSGARPCRTAAWPIADAAAAGDRADALPLGWEARFPRSGYCGAHPASSLNLPLKSEIFLTGDLFPAAPGIQVCPVCNHTCNAGTNNTGPCNTDADCPGAGAGSCTGPNVCHGRGTNNGGPCTPTDSVVGTIETA